MNYPNNIYSFDLEFRENGKIIELISIGIVRISDMKELYLVSSEYDKEKALNHEFLAKNVLPYLGDTKPISRNHIKDKIIEFLGPNPILWASYSSYDHVCFCQLFGTMMDLPEGYPMFTRDIQQELSSRNMNKDQLPKQAGQNHSAIFDAIHVAEIYKFLFPLPSTLSPNQITDPITEGKMPIKKTIKVMPPLRFSRDA